MCLHHMFLSYSISVVVCALTSECGLISGTAEATGRGGGGVWDVVGESCLDRQAAPSYREALKGQDWFWDWEQLLGRGKCVCVCVCVCARVCARVHIATPDSGDFICTLASFHHTSSFWRH